MELSINGEPTQFDYETLTVAELLDQLDIPTVRGVAIAVNDSVVTRSSWDDHRVQDGDRVEIIRATQGG